MQMRRLRSDWEQESRRRWPKLTDEDISAVDGECSNLVDVVERRYGLEHDQAERQVDEFCAAGEPDDVSRMVGEGPAGQEPSGSPRRKPSSPGRRVV
jgi:uncharacterized protein YjbJ (UPF0337 family)